MNVEALADADVRGRVGEPRFGGAEVVHGRDFHVRRVAVEDISLMPRPGGDRRVVGEAVDSGGGGAPMRLEDQRIAERLRCLRRAQARAVWRGDHAAFGVDLLDRVAERRSGHGCAVALGGGDGPRDQRG